MNGDVSSMITPDGWVELLFNLRIMAKAMGGNGLFLHSLDKAKKEQAALVILGGDIVNFPSLASVEHLKAMLDASGLNWTYTAGNHDWHYEGEPGTSFAQREKW